MATAETWVHSLYFCDEDSFVRLCLLAWNNEVWSCRLYKSRGFSNELTTAASHFFFFLNVTIALPKRLRASSKATTPVHGCVCPCVCALCWLISSGINTSFLRAACEVREPLTLPDRPFGRLAPTAVVSLISVESLFIKVSEVDQCFCPCSRLFASGLPCRFITGAS